jgi:TRAP-type mannitol/chloroaromatic compound transport system substrate-binding protein
MTRITRRNLTRGGVLGVADTMAAPAIVAPAIVAPTSAQNGKLRWRMVTSWLGPGMSAERLAERIGALSGGRLDIAVSAAGEVVPAFGVLDAVGWGVAEMGHSAAFYWQGNEPAAAFLPPCLSGSCRTSTSPGSMPAAARRCGTNSTRRSG